MPRITCILTSVIASILLAGCTTPRAPRPAPINHIVFLKLHDPALTSQLIAQSDEQLRSIPAVASYFAGTHLDIGRDSVLHDYDVALYLGFRSEQGLRDYIEHPQHVAYVNAWKPKLEWLKVYDVRDDTP